MSSTHDSTSNANVTLISMKIEMNWKRTTLNYCTNRRMTENRNIKYWTNIMAIFLLMLSIWIPSTYTMHAHFELNRVYGLWHFNVYVAPYQNAFSLVNRQFFQPFGFYVLQIGKRRLFPALDSVQPFNKMWKWFMRQYQLDILWQTLQPF